MSYSIYHDVLINASVEKIFDSISLPHKLENWWPKTCKGIPEKGQSYNFYFGPEYDWYGIVCHFEKNKSFHIKMTKSDEDWDPTTFGFDLEDRSKDVLLHFFHIDWPECNHHFKFSSFCWAMLLNGLKEYVESAAVIPFEKRN